MSMKKIFAGLALMLLVVSIATRSVHAQSSTTSSSSTAATTATTDRPPARDPGVQAASRNTGAGVASLSTTDGSSQFFQNGLGRFQAVETVSNSANVGLGLRFNSVSCVSCHSQPAV